ncbi:MAG: lipopolysaccharide assembly protein LapA domain-containing protein [Lactobacillus sp.]|nr:lipopolysaccharide assembly protein LapA domain-containing protein [Lactobacillus sp.]
MNSKKAQINLVISLLVALIAVIFVVMNTSPVAINFGFFKVKLPLIIVLVVMVIIGILLGWFLGQDKQFNKKKR